jgi:hypothetical protein
MVVGFRTTYAISAGRFTKQNVSPRRAGSPNKMSPPERAGSPNKMSPPEGQVHQTINNYVIKFVSNFRQVSGLLWALRFPPPIKLITTI